MDCIPPYSYLLELPAELLNNIAEFVQASDLCSFRLASKTTFAASKDCFMRRLFEGRHHIVSKRSLETLLAITAIEKLVSKIEALHLYLPTIGGQSDVPVATTTLWDAERSALETENCGEQLIRRIMADLARANKCVEVSLGFVSSDDPEPYGLNTLEKAVGNSCDRGGPIGYGLAEVTDVQKYLLDGIATSGLRLTSLALPGAYTTALNSETGSQTLERLSYTLSALRELKLGQSVHFYSEVESDLEYLKAIVKASTSSMIELEVIPDDGEYLESLLGILPTHRVRKLTLGHGGAYNIPGFETDPFSMARIDHVKDLLRSQSRTIRHLKINVIEVPCRQQYPGLLPWIVENLGLNAFEVQWEGRDGAESRRFYKYEGREEISAGVLELLKEESWGLSVEDESEDESGDDD